MCNECNYFSVIKFCVYKYFVCKIFRAFNFHTGFSAQKYFDTENFPNYGMSYVCRHFEMVNSHLTNEGLIISMSCCVSRIVPIDMLYINYTLARLWNIHEVVN